MSTDRELLERARSLLLKTAYWHEHITKSDRLAAEIEDYLKEPVQDDRLARYAKMITKGAPQDERKALAHEVFQLACQYGNARVIVARDPDMAGDLTAAQYALVAAINKLAGITKKGEAL